MRNTIAVTSSTSTKIPAARLLAGQLSLPFLEDPASPEALAYQYLLLFTPSYLGLHQAGKKLSSPFYLDFLSPKLLYRIKQASLKKELLARAMGIHPRENPQLIDATAGLGRDSFILASLGYKLTLLERSPILHALLKDALSRASLHPVASSIVQGMELINTDSISWLSQHSADIIYLDPMFPQRQKSASVKKEMVILQDLLGKDADSSELFKAALTCATRRVVVKRPRLSEKISEQAPNFSLLGKSSRFDVYLR